MTFRGILLLYNNMILTSIIKIMGVYLRKLVSNLLFITATKSFFYIICERVYISLTFGKILAILFLFSSFCVPQSTVRSLLLPQSLAVSKLCGNLSLSLSEVRFTFELVTEHLKKLESLFLVQCLFLTTQKDCIWLTVVLLAPEELLQNIIKTQKTNKIQKTKPKKHQGKKGDVLPIITGCKAQNDSAARGV